MKTIELHPLVYLIASLNLSLAVVGCSKDAENPVTSLPTGSSIEWVQTNGPIGEASVHSLAVNPSGYLFAATDEVVRSTDNGATWTKTSLTNSAYAQTLAIDPGGQIFAAGPSGLFRSSDDGGNWTQVADTSVAAMGVGGFLVNSSGHIFVGTYGRGVFRSTNAGGSWVQANNGLANLSVRALAVSPVGTVFAGTDDGLFQSTNNGENWIRTSLSHGSIVSAAVSASGDIFAFRVDSWNHYGWMHHSSDGGATWTQSDTYSDDVPSFAFSSGGDIFMGRGCSGVLRSSDNGVNWTQVLTGHNVLTLVINASGQIFAGTGSGVFRSGDNGGSWSQAIIEARAGAGPLVISSSGNMFAATGGGNFPRGISRSTDNGVSWVRVNEGFPVVCDLYPWVMSLAINSKGHVFANLNEGEVIYRSTNGGSSWSQVYSGQGYYELWPIAIDSSDNIFAGTGSGIQRSTDNGGSWTQVLTTQVLVIAFSSNQHIFAGTIDGRVFRSTDKGVTWSQVGQKTGWILSLAVNSQGHLFAGGTGVYRSTDNGSNWTQVGLNNIDRIRTLSINSVGHIFAGTPGGGVFRSTDNGGSWTTVNTGLTGTYVASLAMNSKDFIYAGTWSGVFRSVRPTVP